MAAMALLGAEPEQPSERQQGRMQRGKDAQVYYGKRLAAKYGDEVEHERAVPWPSPPALPIGELHTDFFVPSERLAIEVKSSEAVDSMFEISLKQVKGQVHFDPDCDVGALVFLDRDYQETDVFPVVVTDEDAKELEATAAAVIEAGKTGTLPERTCSRPQEGIGKLCPFIRECFAGWEPPHTEEREDVAPLATEAYLAKKALDQAKADLKPLEERYETARAALADADLPAGETAAGQIVVKRTVVSGSRRFSLSKAEKAGFPLNEEIYGPFITHTEGHSRWSFERVGDDPLDIDYGADPPF
jgi:hypothetical protein